MSFELDIFYLAKSFVKKYFELLSLSYYPANSIVKLDQIMFIMMVVMRKNRLTFS